jgi:hypothetical protein
MSDSERERELSESELSELLVERDARDPRLDSDDRDRVLSDALGGRKTDSYYKASSGT